MKNYLYDTKERSILFKVKYRTGSTDHKNGKPSFPDLNHDKTIFADDVRFFKTLRNKTGRRF